jgi:hypothetical protein
MPVSQLHCRVANLSSFEFKLFDEVYVNRTGYLNPLILGFFVVEICSPKQPSITEIQLVL